MRLFGEREISLRIQHDQPRPLLSTSKMYCAVQTCYSYALWLGALLGGCSYEAVACEPQNWRVCSSEQLHAPGDWQARRASYAATLRSALSLAGMPIGTTPGKIDNVRLMRSQSKPERDDERHLDRRHPDEAADAWRSARPWRCAA